MAETLREYIVALGFEVDASTQSRFENAITKSVALAIGLEHAIEGMARKTIAAFDGMADSYEDLAKKSEMLGQSAASIKAFTFAAQQAGASVSEINGFIDSLISRQRNFGDSKSILGQIFHVDPNSPTLLKDAIASLGKMDKMTAAAYARNSVAGLSIGPGLLDAAHRASFEKYAQEEAERQERLPKDFAENAAQGARRLNQAWRDLAETINGVVTSAFANLTGENGPIQILQAFEQWLLAHSGEIAEAISKLVTNVTLFVEAFASIATGVDSTDPKIKAMVETFNAWGASLKNLRFWLESIAALITGTSILQLFGLIAGVLGVAGTGGLGGLLMGGLGLAAAVGGAYAAYTGASAMMGGGEAANAGAGAGAPPAGGGSRSWRNNNPGNIKYGDFAKSHGATGADSGGFAVFPNEAAGTAAQRALWESPGYANTPFSAALPKWSISGYGPNKLGVQPSGTFAGLNDTEKTHLLQAQRNAEGWWAGAGAGAGGGFGDYAKSVLGGRLVKTSAGALSFTANAEAAPHMKAFFEELMAHGAPITSIGGYNYRQKVGASGLSQHAYGNAADASQIGRNVVTPAFQNWLNSNWPLVQEAERRFHMYGGEHFGGGGRGTHPDTGHWEYDPRFGGSAVAPSATSPSSVPTTGAGWDRARAQTSLAALGIGDRTPGQRAYAPANPLDASGPVAGGAVSPKRGISTADDIWAAVYGMLGIDKDRWNLGHERAANPDMKALGQRVGQWLKSEVNSFGDTLIAHLAKGVDNDATMNAFRNALGMNQARADIFRRTGSDLMGGVGHGHKHQYTVPKNPRSFEQMHAMTKLAPLGNIGTQRPFSNHNTQHNNITIHGADDPKSVMDELHWNTKRLWPMQALRNTTTAAS